MKIGITGATGHLGRLVVKKLKKKTSSDNLIALVRTSEKAKSLGIASRTFDYNKAGDLVHALKGIDHLLLISGNEIGKRKLQHSNVIEAAKEAGVKWIVYTSLLHADKSSISLAPEHLATEQLLQESGIDYTILRNGWYTENYTASLSAFVEAGGLIGSAGDGRISSATREDYAEAAATVLMSEGHVGKVYELAGDEAYTLDELAAVVSKQTGKKIQYNNLTISEYAKDLEGFGLPEKVATAYAGFDFCASKGAFGINWKTDYPFIRCC